MINKVNPSTLFLVSICIVFLIASCFGTDEQNTCTVSTEEQSGIIRVMTFNIHHGEGEDSIYNIERIAKFMQEEKADIILIQEVDSGHSDRSNYQDQPKILAELLDFCRYYGPNIGDTYGNLILSKYPLVNSINIALPNPENKEPRGVIVASVSVNGHLMTLLNTHLSAGGELLNREEQIDYLSVMTDDLFAPVVFGADFNTTPSEQLKPLLDNGLLISSRKVLGFEEDIDDILVSSELQEYIINGEVVPTIYSDHPAYWIDIDIPNESLEQ